LIRLAKLAPRLLVFSGVYLIVISLSLALLLAVHPNRRVDTQSDFSAAAPPGVEQPASIQKAPSKGQPQSDTIVISLIKTLDLKPGTILVWGILLIAASYFIYILRYSLRGEAVRSDIPRSLEDYLRASQYQWERWKELALRARTEGDHETARKLEDYEYERTRIEWENKMPLFAKEAIQLLRDIKFQQSYTSGWSGALKLQLPISLESGITGSKTLAQNQMSNPEIVSTFIKYLTSIPQEFQIIIGIDEMDKLDSDEQAQRFLNEIKSIFGLQRCFYLVSVSENAMSSFERRGLPFRDAFDSSFDSIVYVDYLDVAAARNLMEQRVIGRPIPFFCLSYCLSGGLARDLIRTFRQLMELRQNDSNNNDLSTLCNSIVKAEIKAKVRASAVSAKKIKLDPEVNRFLEKLYELETDVISEQLLLQATEDLFKHQGVNSAKPAQSDQDKKTASRREDLKALIDQLATYFYFAETLLEFFNNSLKARTLKAAEENGKLDKLAQARQALAVDPSISRALLNDFRKSQKMIVPNFLKAKPTRTN
jgi:hypothetical protein